MCVGRRSSVPWNISFGEGVIHPVERKRGRLDASHLRIIQDEFLRQVSIQNSIEYDRQPEREVEGGVNPGLVEGGARHCIEVAARAETQ